MAIQLTPEIEEIVNAKVQTGQYSSATEVVQEALRLLEERECADPGLSPRSSGWTESGFLPRTLSVLICLQLDDAPIAASIFPTFAWA